MRFEEKLQERKQSTLRLTELLGKAITGDVEALITLADDYISGVNKDYKAAKEYLEATYSKADSPQLAKAKIRLGKIYYLGGYGVIKN